MNADATNEEVDSKSARTTDNNKAISKDMHLNCEKGELVLDVLNDDLIEKVRGRITCKSFFALLLIFAFFALIISWIAS